MGEVELVADDNFDPYPDYVKHIITKDPHLWSRFREIIGERKITPIDDLHEIGTVKPNGDLTIFYRYFFTKCVSTRQGVDALSDRINKHASIFPFKTNPHLQVHPVAVAELFDDKFLRETRKFVDYHFSNAFDFENIKNLFLANVDHFKSQQFPNLPSWLELSRIIAAGSTWKENTDPRSILPKYPYLNEFIRLNNDGAQWYKYFQTKYNRYCEVYKKESLRLPEKSELYYKHLPEINCCELLLLLETDFYQQSCRKYTEIFKKYLFFFGHAIRSADAHPVCFIDETLFTCLQFKRMYETFRGDPLKIQWDLWMMTLVHRRKHPLLKLKNVCQMPDQNNLKNVVKYVERIPSIESAVVYYDEPQCRRFNIFLVFGDVAFLLNYSGPKKHSPDSPVYYSEILKSALMNREIRTFIYYNPYLATEVRVDMPQNKTDIRDFIREQTELHQPEPLYPEKFLIQDLHGYDYFERLPAVAHE